MKVVLSKEYTFGEGEAAKTIGWVDLNLEALTGGDILQCTREAEAQKGEVVRVIVMDQDLHLQIASKASGLSVNDLKKLSAKDYVEVITSVQGFLTGSV